MSTGLARRKVVVDFPEKLLSEADRAAQKLSLNRSNFIRSAVAEYIKELRQRDLDHELAEGYAANADLSRRIASEFGYVDSRID